VAALLECGAYESCAHLPSHPLWCSPTGRPIELAEGCGHIEVVRLLKQYASGIAESTSDAAAAATSSSSLSTVSEIVGLASLYMPNYLKDEPAYLEWCRSKADNGEFLRYEQGGLAAGKLLLAGPKIEWYCKNAIGERTKYGWGQTPRFYQAGYPMETEPLVMALAHRIKDEFGETVNHAILKWYADGVEQYSFPHQDKAEGVAGATADKCDMAGDASFYVFTFIPAGVAPRVFTLQKGNGVWHPNGQQKQLYGQDIVWEKALASGSLLQVSPQDNRTYFHALHKKKGAGQRWSLIFRVIKTFIPIDPTSAAEVNDRDLYRFVSKAQVTAGQGVRPPWKELEQRIRKQPSFTTAPERRAAKEQDTVAKKARH